MNSEQIVLILVTNTSTGNMYTPCINIKKCKLIYKCTRVVAKFNHRLTKGRISSVQLEPDTVTWRYPKFNACGVRRNCSESEQATERIGENKRMNE